MIGIVPSSRNLAAWLLGCAAAVAPLEADIVMSLRTTDYSSPEQGVEETRMMVRPAGGESASAGLLKMDISSELRNHTLVFRGGESSSITVIDHHKKSFSVIDRESMAVFRSEMRMRMQATAMRIGSLPPEQREIVQKMLESQLGPDRGADAPPTGTVIRTDERETLSGLACVKHEVFQGGKKLREVWVAPPAAVPGGESALALLREMSDFYGSLMSSVEKAAPGFDGGLSNQNPFEDLARMNGFPVLTRSFVGGRAGTEVALLSVEEQPLSPAEFEPPEDYSPVVMTAPGPVQR